MLGENILKLRKDKGYTQTALANKLNERFSIRVNKSMISKWENNKESPSLENVRCLSIIFGVTLDAMLGINNERALERHEKILIEKFNSLDRSGKDTVLVVLDAQYQRCNPVAMVAAPTVEYTEPRHKKSKVVPLHSEEVFVNAAHAIRGASEEDIQHDEDIMNDDDF